MDKLNTSLKREVKSVCSSPLVLTDKKKAGEQQELTECNELIRNDKKGECQ